ncbi:MAG: RNA methyltransferase [Sphingobacteriales bacterium 17-39-43]|uniref:RsmB/NOP family class I SAM-dependent RNA methyltransferase n=1 Tax=Daejeonella sp. TaxID=2805397 RepID=UPI000BC843D3|nr:RsmB/NOP family class I SAM-dependent RNA methyltransferase [Daejeonella sp.]OYY02572.1 MAG: RNA methyltransferase [Sphingobacteriia bacterium 35-40-5]OYZ33339.1 MAG: RNA methyltransferase [Sphingobacteriales bacterium 16-39-50]OZA26748.1 MAG: RNA methyltransferase [Sphingobacteriales bacterium 17-39-43]HQT22354.1 RsmB/NOP family class I SAM-dependent RNA methyltransferase [Daejeonella sp.]HQT56805.1 RsmB/NOP family class I SAM-dependent RNA methyltransferase [Daejeonella sp.]
MRAEQQLRTFMRVFEKFPADKPLAKFLPEFFKRNKQMGSNDRRSASRLLYNYFRLGRAVADKSVEQRLFLAEFLCTSVDNPFLHHFRPDLNEKIYLTSDEKINFASLNEGLVMDEVFPFTEHLSDGIDKGAFLRSFFVQPDLFIRIHPKAVSWVLKTLEESNVDFSLIAEHTVALPNGTNLNTLFPDNSFPVKPYEVQDLSSQKTAAYFKPNRYEYWWDACAASGGKSLLLFSEQPDIKLLVSDIRESVLENLDERFIAAGLRTYQKKLIDLTKNADPEIHHYEFDGIILDAPCTGSGTWGRTPEMISQFEEYKIRGFQNLQMTIAANVIRYLKQGKPLIYITCSVFREENEEIVSWLQKNHGMQLDGYELIKGYENKADTMFVARLNKL